MYGVDKMLCVKDKASFSLQGDFYSTEFRYLEVKLFKCNSQATKVTCKNSTQIDSYFNSKTFSFAFVNTYLDFLSYDKPVRQFLDDSLFFHIESQREKKANFYVMKAEIQLEDDLIQLGQGANDIFPSVENIRTYDDSVDADASIISIFIRYDQQFYIYNRQVYSIMQMLGDVGGFQQALCTLALIILSYFTRRLFVSQLFKELYQVKFDRG